MRAPRDLERALLPLRDRLFEGNLGFLCHLWSRRVYSGLDAPAPPPSWGADLSPGERTVFELFCLGQEVSTKRAREALGGDGLSALESSAILEHRQGETRSTGVVLLPILGRFLFVGHARLSDGSWGHVHYGPDSRTMAHALLHLAPGRRFLDLCSGSGILAASMAEGGGTGVAVEWSEIVCRIARVNLALCGLGERIEIRNGDLFEPLAADETFDLVASNPPFSPSSLDIESDPAGAGGLDGLDVVRAIWSRARRILAPGGRMVIFFAALGDGETLQCADELERLATTTGCRVEVFLSDPPQPVDRLTVPRGASRQKLIRDAAEQLGASHYHSVLLSLRRAAGAGLYRFHTYPLPSTSMAHAVHRLRAARRGVAAANE